MNMSALSTKTSGDNMKLIYLDPKTITAAQISEIIDLVSKAFVDFNKSLTTNVHQDLMDEEFGDATIAAIAIKGIATSRDGFALLDGEDGRMVGVSYVDVNAPGPNKVAELGPVCSLSPGAGRKTFEAACQHAEKLGFNVLVLQQVAANNRSFSLYAKVGFEAKHTCHYFGGFLSADSNDADSGVSCTISEMTEKDVEECGALFTAAYGYDCWDRRPSIVHQMAGEQPFPILVARGADGEVVGYSTGFYLDGHQVTQSEDVFKALFRESSRIHKENHLPTPKFHNFMEYPSLVSWALAEKLILLRTTVVMVKGPYNHTWPQNGYVITPSIGGW